jgi:hypothetical protein
MSDSVEKVTRLGGVFCRRMFADKTTRQFPEQVLPGEGLLAFDFFT